MKIKSLSLENFSKYAKVKVNFDEKITYLIGPNGSGKSSLGLSGLWFVMQGIAEKTSKGNNPLIGERFRFIGEKTAFAKGEIVMYDEKTGHEVTVTRHMTKDASKLTFFTASGAALDQQWLNDIFNIFMIAPKVFMELTSKEQAQALNIDTSKYDTEIADLKADLTLLNKELKAFGDINAPEKVEKVDVMELQAKKEAEQERIKKEQQQIDVDNSRIHDNYKLKCNEVRNQVDAFNQDQDDKRSLIDTANDLLSSLIELGYEGTEVSKWIAGLPLPEKKKYGADGEPVYEYPKEPVYKGAADQSKITEIDKEILLASVTNEKAMAYRTYLETLKKKIDKEKEIDTNKTAQKNAEQKRTDYLKSFKLPFDNLTIDEEGRLMLDGRPVKEPYFSTGELLKIVPVIIASTMPDESEAAEFKTRLRYVYLQLFNLMDPEKQQEVIDYLTGKGFQLVIEYVGKEELVDKNCIVLSEMQVINKKPDEPEAPPEDPTKQKLLF